MRNDLVQRLKRKNDHLVGLVRQSTTLSLLSCCAIELFKVRVEGISASDLTSPYRQIFHLLGLMLVTPPEDPRDNDSKDWKAIQSDLQDVFLQYQWMYFPTKDDDVTDEWLKAREVTMPVFLEYFNTGPLLYTEQFEERLQNWFSPFSDYIEEVVGLPLNRMLDVARWVLNQLQTRLDNLSETKEIADRERYRFLDEAIKQSWSIDEMYNRGQKDVLLRDAMVAYINIAYNEFERLFVVSQVEMQNAFSVQEAKAFLSLFAAERGAFSDYYYPTEENPAVLRPLFWIDSDSLFCPYSARALFDAILRQCEQLLRVSPKHRDFIRHRDKRVEEQAGNIFKQFLPSQHPFFRNVYETPDSHNEHDLLIQLGARFLVIEAKATPPKEPFRDPDKAFDRIQRDFHSVKGIQKSFEQANRLRGLLLSDEATILYDRKGNIVLEVDGAAKEVFCVCVTSESFGILATDLALLLKKETIDPYPWAVCLPDLETILEGFRYEGKGLEDFLEFLRKRSELHGRVMSTDELEIAGYYLRYGGFESILDFEDGPVFLTPDMSDIFDEIYSEKLGLSSPKQRQVEDPPTFVDVGEQLRQMLEEDNRVVERELKKRKIGRNERCPCGSGRKYKHCHGR